MITLKRPYLVLPKFIEQPTWGGNYIVEMKNLVNNPSLKSKKIGQSYELFSGSKLLTKITDSDKQNVVPELGTAESTAITNNVPYKKGVDYINLPNVTELYKKIMLIKITQALGNSFQLHIKTATKDKKWRPKPESWYYLENGLLTFGIKKDINIHNYQQACRLIELIMNLLSKQVKSKKISINTAREKMLLGIKKINPWQYVNLHQIKKGSLIDLSSGGIHHSWEEDRNKYPMGNVLYEIQKDVMDPISTIRAFDQGKISNNGTIREIHINDYFKYLDTNPQHNNIINATLHEKDGQLLSTPYYCLNKLIINKNYVDLTKKSFVHLFVLSGKASITSEDGAVIVSKGYSCFIPEIVGKYTIKPLSNNLIILKAFINN